jgi:hypothetical protein
MKMTIRKRTAILIALLAWWGSLASGTSLVRMSVADMTRISSAVVRARCMANETGWQGGEIWTVTTFSVEETWKGATAIQIRVRLPGGSTGGLTSTIAGVPRFMPGEDVVLFLEAKGKGEFSVVSWMQGTFRVWRDVRSGGLIAWQDTAGFEEFDFAARENRASHPRATSLAALEAEVSGATVETKGRKP